MTLLVRILAIIVALAFAMVGCGHGVTNQLDVEQSDSGSSVGEVQDLPDVSSADVGSESNDAAMAADASSPVVSTTPPDLSIWDTQWESCVRQFSPEPATDEPWELPNRTTEGAFNRTPDELKNQFGTEIDVYNFSAHPDLKVRREQSLLYDVWAEPGQDVILRATILRSQESWSTNGARVVATAALDYHPTDIEVALKGHPQEPDLATGIGGVTGAFPPGYVAYVDFRFPAEVFTPGRTHEISLNIRTPGPDMFGDASRRLNVHYGGYTVASEELCADEQETSASTEWERQFDPGLVLVHAFVTPLEWRYRQLEPVVVEPGATQRIYLTFNYISRDRVQKNIAWVPVLNGKHLTPVRFYRGGGNERNPFGPLSIDARSFIDIEFPEEPGIYEFWISGWQDPWKRYRPIDSADSYAGVDSGDDFGSSNVIQFEVRE